MPYTFVYPPTINWSRLRQRPQQLLRALAAAGHTCYFCDLPLPGEARTGGMSELSPRLHLVHDAKALRREHLPKDQMVVLLYTLPGTERMAAQIGADLLLFDHVDEAADEFASWAHKLDRAVQAADAMLVVSERLYGLFDGAHPHVSLVRNGVNPEDFAAAAAGRLAIPEELAAIRQLGPVIGFYGALASWLDWDLIRSVAMARPEWQVVLIGPEYTAGCTDGVRPMPNVHFLGEKWYEELPAYAQGFDVAILPFQVRDMTNSSSPVKVYEYLAAGLPVVATPIREMQSLSPGVQTAGTPAVFVAACEAAMAVRHDPVAIEERLQLARENSWARRAVRAAEAVEQALGQAVPARVMIGAPVRNRAWALPRYLEALQTAVTTLPGLDGLVSYTWVVNDCTDHTPSVLEAFARDRPDVPVRIIRYDMGAAATASEMRGQYSYHHLAHLRNVLLDAFLESDAEYLLSIDSDLILPAKGLRRLLSHQVDLVAALVDNDASGTQPAWNIMRPSQTAPGRFERILDPLAHGLLEVGLTGACILIHRRVIEAGVRYSHHPQGEDGGFCLAATAAGFPIWADCGVRCLHRMTPEEGGD